MDIGRWLECTADRAPPDPSSDHNIPEALRSHCVEPDRVGRGYHHGKKRRLSNSSVIAPINAWRAEEPAHSQLSQDVRHHTARALPQSPGRLHSTHSALDDVPTTKTYEKRARHKTRPDRYEHKTRKQEKERDARKESKPKRRKSHRSGDGHRTTGLVQSFQLKNGPKNNRLTLKQDANVGLFKHGRASVEMAGRRAGLPDLTFNEMRFLQRPKDHQDEHREDEPLRQPTKHDKRPNQEEISAYFNTRTGVSNEGPNIAKKRSRQSDRVGSDHQDRHHAVRPDRVSPVELPEKPFLGFGSRGGRPESRRDHDQSTAYYTWSESAPPRSPPIRGKRPAAPTCDVGELSAKRLSHRQSKPESRHEGLIPEQQHDIDRDDRDNPMPGGKWVQTRTNRGPTFVEMYQPAQTPKPGAEIGQLSATRTTSQSLPKRSSSQAYAGPERSDEVSDRVAQPLNYRTSDILRIYDARGSSECMAGAHAQSVPPTIGTDKENRDPRSSLSIDKVLRHVRKALKEPPKLPNPPEVCRRHVSKDSTVTRVSQLAHDSPDETFRPEEGTRTPVVHHNRTVQHTRESLESRLIPRIPVPRVDAYPPSRAAARVSVVQGGGTHPPIAQHEDEEMLDDHADLGDLLIAEAYVYANARDAEDLVYDRAPEPEPSSGIFEAQAERLERPSDYQWLLPDSEPKKMSPMRGLSAEAEFRAERPVGLNSEVDVDLAGFWKPHKLY